MVTDLRVAKADPVADCQACYSPINLPSKSRELSTMHMCKQPEKLLASQHMTHGTDLQDLQSYNLHK